MEKIALEVIKNSITPYGLLASSHAKDNYKRIWSRDAMMTGIVGGVLSEDQEILKAFEASILSLSNYQSEVGQIPSNIDVEKNQVSYGSLVGRVDATTWWIIGTCVYLNYIKNEAIKNKLLPKLIKALDLLEVWEYNGRGLIYTPLGGNWADEYITSGYTLYDNVLRYWSLKSFSKIYTIEKYVLKCKEVEASIKLNFNSGIPNNTDYYHPKAYKQFNEKKLKYLPSSFSSNGYDCRWDMAGNALALLLGLNDSPDNLIEYLNSLYITLDHWMLPVFYPIIKPTDWQWHLLENNYSYNFKNIPYHFHNGGSWPIFLGWLCYGLKTINKNEQAILIQKEFENLINKFPNNKFNEYWSTDQLLPKGTDDLCFSASGYLLMNTKVNQELI